MRYLEFLEGLHAALEPPAYLEIGVRHGKSLALAECPAIGVDPSHDLRVELGRQATLFGETSDEFFRRADPLAPVGGRPVGLSFVDGMHLVEYALTDFIGVERLSHWTGVVVFDDVLPRDDREAARRRRTRDWTGDVFKIASILAEHRPDLIRITVDTEPTGLLVVIGLDPASRRLARRYERIVSQAVLPDPQHVPRHVLARRGALAPEAVLRARFWTLVREARDRDLPREGTVDALRDAVRRELAPRFSLRRRSLAPV